MRDVYVKANQERDSERKKTLKGIDRDREMNRCVDLREGEKARERKR